MSYKNSPQICILQDFIYSCFGYISRFVVHYIEALYGEMLCGIV